MWKMKAALDISGGSMWRRVCHSPLDFLLIYGSIFWDQNHTHLVCLRPLILDFKNVKIAILLFSKRSLLYMISWLSKASMKDSVSQFRKPVTWTTKHQKHADLTKLKKWAYSRNGKTLNNLELETYSGTIQGFQNFGFLFTFMQIRREGAKRNATRSNSGTIHLNCQKIRNYWHVRSGYFKNTFSLFKTLHIPRKKIPKFFKN